MINNKLYRASKEALGIDKIVFNIVMHKYLMEINVV